MSKIRVKNKLLIEAQKLKLKTVSELAYYIRLSKILNNNSKEYNKYINYLKESQKVVCNHNEL